MVPGLVPALSQPTPVGANGVGVPSRGETSALAAGAEAMSIGRGPVHSHSSTSAVSLIFRLVRYSSVGVSCWVAATGGVNSSGCTTALISA